ncbi:MAG: hypothetical protein F4X43_04320 [Acidobacteria bacterium]|nr:hypothetical protein [Gemmatimonadota bacterium]MYA45579.1 hypothetical protein [Acidobacteriota bacterium]MYI37552.1 hypothetical protein [Acidobacteriota bacterium]
MTAAASPSPTLAERAAALRGLGWTAREAEWLALVCLHSGVFTRSQYQARYRLSKPTAGRFVSALLDAGIAREEPMPNRRGPEVFCHVHHRSVYRGLGIENSRHRRRGAADLIMRRLLSLDYVLEHEDLGWLPTEPEKVAYFQGLGIPVATLPRRDYRGASRRSTRRYFAFKLPVAGNGTATTFVFADIGGRRRVQRERIRAWADAHGFLWQALRDCGCAVHVVAVTRTGDDAAVNAAILDSWRGEHAPAVPLPERDKGLLAAVDRARDTGDLAPLADYGGPIEATNAARAIREQERTARAAAGHIDAYRTHVAERLAPDPLAL